MNIQDYVTVSVMAAVWILIQIFKKPVFDRFKMNDFIPLFAAFLGVVFVLWINGQISFPLFLEGLASGFAATGMNEGINAVFFREDGGDAE